MLSWALREGRGGGSCSFEKSTELGYKETEYGRTTLSLAAECGCEEVVKLLLEKDVDRDYKGYDPYATVESCIEWHRSSCEAAPLCVCASETIQSISTQNAAQMHSKVHQEKRG
jgi:hypothetical protein